MSLLIGFLTFILVVNCLFLMLLVLVQLPKKEAGAGLAFGAGAVDTLIGAGSGNALTKLTKYSAGIFLGLAIVIAVLNTQRHSSSTGYLRQELSKRPAATAPALPAAQQPAAAPVSSGTLPTANQSAPANQDTAVPTLQLTPQTAAPANATAPAATTPTGTPPAAPANTGTTQPKS